MTKEWEDSGKEFLKFIAEIEKIRDKLYCNQSSAWFRGETKFGRDLDPTLLRIKGKVDTERTKEIKILKRKELSIMESWKKLEEQRQDLKNQMSDFFFREREENSRIANLYRKVKLRQTKFLKEKDIIKHQIKTTRSIQRGEEEAFIDWRRRVDSTYDNSWETLVEMQHYGVPTRLLDWSENLSVSLFFALRKYREKLEEHWENSISKKMEFYIPDGLPNPCIWILNPYKLSRVSSGTNNILDPTQRENLDYYKSWFVNKNWKYDKVIPIYSPWKNSRIHSQQGIFTVHGLDERPLNKQLKPNNDILGCIVIEPKVAVYAVRHLKTFFGMDEFYLFRDYDRLGQRVRKRFISPK